MNAAATQPAQKKPYTSPTLVAYGAVSKLTQNGAGSGVDAGGPNMTMMCL